jgi:hypothetical protein
MFVDETAIEVAAGQHVAGPHQGLGGDARPVGAFAADQLPLDDGDLEAAVGAAAGGVLPGRAGADHDHVELVHGPLSLTGRSRSDPPWCPRRYA